MSSFNKLSIITKYVKGFDVTCFSTIHSIKSDIQQHTKNTFITSFNKTDGVSLKWSCRAIPAMCYYVLWLILIIRATYEFGYLCYYVLWLILIIRAIYEFGYLLLLLGTV